MSLSDLFCATSHNKSLLSFRFNFQEIVYLKFPIFNSKKQTILVSTAHIYPRYSAALLNLMTFHLIKITSTTVQIRRD